MSSPATSLWGFAAAAGALAITPGPTAALVVRYALAGGRSAGYRAAIGAMTANAIHATLAGAGVTLLVQRSPMAFRVLQAVGGAYLAWLGVRALRQAYRSASALGGSAQQAAATGSAFVYGLLANLLNPAVITFYLTVVPSFVPPGGGPSWFARLAAIHIALALTCLTGWATAFHSLRSTVTKPSVARALDLGAATVLIGLAARSLMRAW